MNFEGCLVVGNSKHAKDFRNEDMAVDLTNKECVVTGANQGIGYACAEALAARYIFYQTFCPAFKLKSAFEIIYLTQFWTGTWYQ